MRNHQLINQDELVIAKPYTPTIQTAQLSNPSRTVVTDESGNWLATFTNGSRTVNVKGPARTFIQHDVPLVDEFTRTRDGTGWGLSTFGGTWSASGGTDPGNYSVNGTEGDVVVDTANVSRRMYLSTVLSNPDVKVRVKSDKLAVGDNHGASILFHYQDTSNHHLAKLDFVPRVVTDVFARTSSSGWGTATSGQAWTTSGGTGTDYTVASGVATHSVGALNSSRRTLIGSATDSDVTVRVKTAVLATGTSFTAAMLARYQDSSNHYLLRMRLSTAQSVFGVIQKQVAGVTSDLATEVQASGITHAAGSYLWMRGQVIGTQLRLKIWADGTSEPADWLLTISDPGATFTSAGSLGLRTLTLTGNTNTLPVVYTFADYAASMDGGNDAVELRLQKRVAGTTITLGSASTVTGLAHTPGAFTWLRVRSVNGVIQSRMWVDGSSEPESWQVTQTDTSFTTGKVGLRAVAETGVTNLPVKVTFDDFSATGVDVPTVVQHDHWVRVLPAAFTGTVDTTWLINALNDSTPDALSVAMEYINQAPPVTTGVLQTAGNAHYGPLEIDGKRGEGSDFNDYLGVTWTYGSSSDSPEPDQIGCVDCSGYVRMVYGCRLGLPMRLTTLDGLSIPRVSGNIMSGALGTYLIPTTGSQVTDFTTILPGDIVGFDADVTNPDENEGQVDHVGIFLGVDPNGHYRFLSSRKSADGPTFSDLGGASILDGTGLYARTYRSLRRF